MKVKMFLFICLVLSVDCVFGQTYRLEWNEQSVSVAGISGLEPANSTLGYRTIRLSGTTGVTSTASKTISLSKIRCLTVNELYRWFNMNGQSGLQKRDLKVKQIGTNGEVIKAWKIIQAGPLNMSVPQPLNADANVVLIETLTLSFEKVEPDW